MSSASDPSSEDISSISKSLKQTREVILEAIATAPSQSTHVSYPSNNSERPIVKTSYITDKTELPNNTVGYHAQQLIHTGLIERVEGEIVPPDTSSGNPDNAYRCTEVGLEVARFEEEFPVGASIEDLRDEYERQRQEIAELKETINTLEEKFETIATQHNKLVDTVTDGDGLD